jgi:hypothetical protein
MRFGLPARQIFVRFLCALSLALVAFGHQPLSLPRSGTLAIAAYAFPDGSQPVICLTDTAGKGDQKSAHGHGCDACRISSAFALQLPCFAVLAVSDRRESPLPLPPASPVIRAAYPPSAPPQAPPLSA